MVRACPARSRPVAYEGEKSMAIKLVLTDIDGTIMPYGRRQVTERCRAAFHAAMDAGLLVGPASGRFYSWIPNFFGGDEACCQTALATNGMQVYLGGQKVLQKELPVGALRRIMAELEQIPRAGLLVFQGSTPLLVQGSREDLAIAFPAYAKTCEDAPALPEEGITKANVFLVGDLDRTREVVARLDAVTDELDLDVPQPMFSNVVPAGWNKGAALRWLCERAGVSPEETVVFGDAGNDLQMFAATPNSVAVANALPEARDAARYHIGPVDEDAVPAAIEALARGEWPFAD